MGHKIDLQDFGNIASKLIASADGEGLSKSIYLNVEMQDGKVLGGTYSVYNRITNETQIFNSDDAQSAVEAYNSIGN